MTLEQVIQQKKAELYALPIHQKMVSGEVDTLLYLRYIREMKFIHDYIDHKSDFKDFLDMKREMSIHVDILELVNDLYPAEINPIGLGEDYAIFNMFQSKERANAHAYIHYREYLESSDNLKNKIPGKGRLYTFNDKQILLQHLEENKPSDEWIEECEKAYDIRIFILKELQKEL
jgi:hypothetical protein